MFHRSLYLMFSVFLLWGCVDLNRKARIEKLSKLTSELSLMLDSLDNDDLDTTEFLDLMERTFAIGYHINDTIEVDFMYRLDSLNRVKNSFEERNAIFNYVRVAIPHRISEQRALAYDLENDYGKREQYDDYIHDETTNVDSIRVLFQRYQELNKELERGMDFVDHFLSSGLNHIDGQNLTIE